MGGGGGGGARRGVTIYRGYIGVLIGVIVVLIGVWLKGSWGHVRVI